MLSYFLPVGMVKKSNGKDNKFKKSGIACKAALTQIYYIHLKRQKNDV